MKTIVLIYITLLLSLSIIQCLRISSDGKTDIFEDDESSISYRSMISKFTQPPLSIIRKRSSLQSNQIAIPHRLSFLKSKQVDSAGQYFIQWLQLIRKFPINKTKKTSTCSCTPCNFILIIVPSYSHVRSVLNTFNRCQRNSR